MIFLDVFILLLTIKSFQNPNPNNININIIFLQKCMTTGMNPSWVLSDEQRKKRFKKYRSDDLSYMTIQL